MPRRGGYMIGPDLASSDARERYYQQDGGEQLNALLMRRDLS